ncbi:hypothetical protein MCOR25_002030 [Pyricularia grisea]|uniref:Cytochrome P450 n=1 Tax=Pyricularia grisea TaxID=148305 RepID=A0A6P8AMI5_PYRGI|nr:uncharacterized protein PgNI_12437 [Pyricularia grisea]KAI6379154.1 hypothetical protein MCOR25_002030 [Pyricularia grisea]TLD03229.1 hypothetical protein PgNI_12437 [Pyricularia grisea]
MAAWCSNVIWPCSKPNSTVLLIGAVLLIVSYSLGKLIYNVYFHPLCEYPGPRLWAATRIPYTRYIVAGQMHKKILELHEKYGAIVRVSPDELSYNSSNAWRDLYGHVKGKTGDHGRDPVATYDHREGLFGAKLEDHPRFRRAISHGFSAQAMMEQQPIIAKYVDLFIKKLNQRCASGSQPLNMVQWYDFVTFDIVGDLTFGEPFNCLQNSEYHQWVTIIFENIKLAALGIQARRFPTIAKLLEYLIPARLLKQREQHNALTSSKVSKRLEVEGERQDFMDSMLQNWKNKNEFTRIELEVTSAALIMAGSETTATALSAITYLLTKHPEAMMKLSDEVRGSFAAEHEIDMNSVKRLRYVNAVISEGMRLCPPVPTGFPRRVREGGGLFLGRHVPEGTLVMVWQWAAYHSPENFALPDSFIPERWLDEDARFVSDKKNAFQPFSLGPMSCIGMNLANAELRFILAKMVWNFDMKLHPDSQNWFDGLKTYILWQKPPLHVYLTPRTVNGGKEATEDVAGV